VQDHKIFYGKKKMIPKWEANLFFFKSKIQIKIIIIKKRFFWLIFIIWYFVHKDERLRFKKYLFWKIIINFYFIQKNFSFSFSDNLPIIEQIVNPYNLCFFDNLGQHSSTIPYDSSFWPILKYCDIIKKIFFFNFK
jgi:hypothetical protein